jgi:hypothetical protein
MADLFASDSAQPQDYHARSVVLEGLEPVPRPG